MRPREASHNQVWFVSSSFELHHQLHFIQSNSHLFTLCSCQWEVHFARKTTIIAAICYPFQQFHDKLVFFFMWVTMKQSIFDCTVSASHSSQFWQLFFWTRDAADSFCVSSSLPCHSTCMSLCFVVSSLDMFLSGLVFLTWRFMQVSKLRPLFLTWNNQLVSFSVPPPLTSLLSPFQQACCCHCSWLQPCDQRAQLWDPTTSTPHLSWCRDWWEKLVLLIHGCCSGTSCQLMCKRVSSCLAVSIPVSLQTLQQKRGLKSFVIIAGTRAQSALPTSAKRIVAFVAALGSVWP